MICLFLVLCFQGPDQAHLLQLKSILFLYKSTNNKGMALEKLETFFTNPDLSDLVLKEANYVAGEIKRFIPETEVNRNALINAQLRMCWFEPTLGPFILIETNYHDDVDGIPRSVTNKICGYIITDIGMGYAVFRHGDDVIVKKMLNCPENPASWNRWGHAKGTNRIFRFSNSFKNRFTNTKVTFIVDQMTLARFLKFSANRLLIQSTVTNLPTINLNGIYRQKSLGYLVKKHLEPEFHLRFEGRQLLFEKARSK